MPGTDCPDGIYRRYETRKWLDFNLIYYFAGHLVKSLAGSAGSDAVYFHPYRHVLFADHNKIAVLIICLKIRLVTEVVDIFDAALLLGFFDVIVRKVGRHFIIELLNHVIYIACLASPIISV